MLLPNTTQQFDSVDVNLLPIIEKSKTDTLESVEELINNTSELYIIKNILSSEYSISDYHELNGVTTRNWALMIAESPILKKFVAEKLNITDLRNFKEDTRELLWIIIFPNTDLMLDLRKWLMKIWIYDYESFLEYVYVEWDNKKISIVLKSLKKQTKKVLYKNNIDAYHFKNRDFDEIINLLWWKIDENYNVENIVTTIKSYDIFKNVKYIEELQDISKKFSKDKHKELYIYTVKYLWIEYIPAKEELRENDNNILDKVWLQLWFKKLDITDVTEKVWDYTMWDNERINPNVNKRWNAMSKFFIKNTKFVLRIKEVRIYFIQELWLHNTNNLSHNDINWFTSILKNSI